MLVVTITTVREAMAQMGTPDDFGADNSTSTTDEKSNTNQRDFKSLRRSRTDRVLAGVCGGLAEHFGIDTAMLRLATILLILFGLTVFLLLPQYGINHFVPFRFVYV